MKRRPAFCGWIALAAALAPASAAARPIAGFNVPMWSRDGYAAPTAQASLLDLARTGAGWIALTPTHYMTSTAATRIAATDLTPSDDSVRTMIRQARGLGLKVALKPHIDVLDGTPRLLIDPSDADAWFARYEEVILHYADLSREEGVELLVAGTELRLMARPRFQRNWKGLIAEIRRRYSGVLTYAANWDDYAQVPFWERLDLIGVDGYFPIDSAPELDALREGWRAHAAAAAATAQAAGKPVLFTEIGLCSRRGAQRQPWRYDDFGPVDLQTQAAYLESFLDVMSAQPFFAGFLHWAWDPRPSAGGPADPGMAIQGKPALAVLERYFRPAPRSPSTALSLDAAADRALKALGPAPFVRPY